MALTQLLQEETLADWDSSVPVDVKPVLPGQPEDARPDSTIQERDWARKPFSEGEDILVHDQDGLIYFGIVVEVDQDIGQCLVRFGDSTERWSNFYELSRLGDTEEGHEPYGKTTTTPPPKPKLEPPNEQLKTETADSAEDAPEEVPPHVIDARRQLSYNFESLVWDSAHQRNESETYCYCGESGDWYKKMLQCKDCLQWFHQECIRSLSYQLLCGDRFFEFTCTLCNGKEEEYIRRLDLSLVDASHLVIFNLILSKNQNFHDLETSIIPLMKKKLKYLQGTGPVPSFKHTKVDPDYISKLLVSNKSRFKCGSETGKKNSFWGLRKMLAPPLPSKYFPRYWGRWATGPKSVARPNNCLEVKSKKGRKLSLKHVPQHPHLRRSKARFKDISGEHSDSDASSRGTLDFLIKPPKDFFGANNPFRISVTPSESSESRGDTTPNSSLRRVLSSEKGSPVSSGPPSTITTDDCYVEDLLQATVCTDRVVPNEQDVHAMKTGQADQDDVFKSPGIKFEDLKGSLNSYFAPSVKKRIERGDKFRVKARRLTLNGDIAYLIDWDSNS